MDDKLVNTRILQHGAQRSTQVEVRDLPGPGNACHEYHIQTIGELAFPVSVDIQFQEGPIKENGVNGIHNEDLLAIVIDRLEGFQSGEYSCQENALALTKLQDAMYWLNHRTNVRQARGVEGTSEV